MYYKIVNGHTPAYLFDHVPNEAPRVLRKFIPKAPITSQWITGPTENIKSCRPVQYEQKRITKTQENDQEKRFLHILTTSICEMRQKPFRFKPFRHFSWTSR